MTASVLVATVLTALSEVPSLSVKRNIFVYDFKHTVHLGILYVSEGLFSIILSFVTSWCFSFVSNISDICVGGLEDDINLVQRGQIGEPEESVSPNNKLANSD